jgi:Uma2 family endonuclease
MLAKAAEVFNMSGLSPNAQTLYSFDDLLEIEESGGVKHELFDGHIVAMTGGTKAHNLIALGLFTEIDRQKDENCRLYVADVKLRIDRELSISQKDSSTYPDVMLACGEEHSDLYEESPLLLAEVLSDNTARKDKITKKNKYLELPTLYVYLIFSQTEIMVTVYQKRDGVWSEHIFLGKDTEIDLYAGEDHPALQLNLGSIYKYLAERI